MFFRSERLFLRPGWPEDWSELFGQIADYQTVRHLARAPWPYRPEDAQEFAALIQDPRHPHFLITLPGAEGARLIGCAGLGAALDEHGPELGYWIARDHRGRGYATEACRAVLALARTLGHRIIHAGGFADAPAATRVLRKVGLRSTGIVAPRFSLLRGETVPAEIHTLTLPRRSDCDGAVDQAGAMRAA